eukprot:gene9-2332_t
MDDDEEIIPRAQKVCGTRNPPLLNRLGALWISVVRPERKLVKTCGDMGPETEAEVVEFAQLALDDKLELHKDIATHRNLDDKLGGTWHVIVGDLPHAALAIRRFRRQRYGPAPDIHSCHAHLTLCSLPEQPAVVHAPLSLAPPGLSFGANINHDHQTMLNFYLDKTAFLVFRSGPPLKANEKAKAEEQAAKS